jgi:methionyl aminopeptidase
MKIYYKTSAEIEKIRVVSRIVSDILDVLEDCCHVGVSTFELNEIAEHELKKSNALSAFLGYSSPPYPAVLCTSINDVVVHGVPRRDHVLMDGDIIGLDFGAFFGGFCGDSARTIVVGNASEQARKLVWAARESLHLGISKAVPGARLQDIGWAIQSFVEPIGFSVVRKFVGHGIGRAMHEDPQVPNYGEPNKGLRLKVGLVLAIEPMVNAGTSEVDVLDDGWTAVTRDGKLSAHFEHTVAITENGPLILSGAYR